MAWRSFVELLAALDACESGESQPPNEPAPQRELRLGRFLIRDEVGRGGFGIVLRAFDPLLDREVALKLPHPGRLLAGHSAVRFLAEAQAAAAAVHPGIVRVYETGRIGPIWYIVSEFCDGPTLSNWIARRAPVPNRVAAELIAQIADAVQHAHSRGILHRDLKPANILLSTSEDGQLVPKVSDFGLASRSIDASSSPSQSGMAGTIAYMAPEQTLDDQSRVGTAADVYALGVMLFELLTGQVPFSAASEAELIEQVRRNPAPRLRMLRGDIPRDLDAICAKCLAKDSVERYDSAAGLARDLRRFLAGACVEARPVGPIHRTWRWCRRRPAVAALAAALVFAVLCGGAVSLRQWRRAEHNLQQAEVAVVNLGWAIDNAAFWQNDNDSLGPEQRQEVTRRYANLLEQLQDRPTAKSVRAAADCFFARIDAADGKLDLAHERFRRSILQWHELVRSEPHNMFFRRELAKTLYSLAMSPSTSDHCATELSRFEGDKLLGHLAVEERFGSSLMLDYANVVYEKGEAQRKNNCDFAAAEHYLACVNVCRRILATAPHSEDVEFRRLQSLARLDSVHRPGASRLRTYQTRTEVLDGLRALLAATPDRNEYRLEHAKVAAWLAVHAGSVGRNAKCDHYLEDAAKSLDILVASNDCPPEAKRVYGDILKFNSLRQLALKQPTAAMQCAKQSLHWYDFAELAGAIGALPHARACQKLGEVYLSCGADNEAVVVLERAAKLYEAACGGAPRSRAVHLQYADVWRKLSTLYERTGRSEEALAASEQAVRVLEAWRGPKPTEPHVASLFTQLRSTHAAKEVN